MGNVMNTCIERKQTKETQVQQQQQQQQKVQAEEVGGLQQASKVRIKLVMTKEELGWLLLHLQDKEGKKIKDVLGEIEKGKSVKSVEMGWKPSLESIMESPEVIEMDRL